MTLDFFSLGAALFGLASTVLVIYLLRKATLKVKVGVGGALLLLSVTLLGIAYGLISGTVVWVLTAVALVSLASFSYLALRRPETA